MTLSLIGAPQCSYLHVDLNHHQHQHADTNMPRPVSLLSRQVRCVSTCTSTTPSTAKSRPRRRDETLEEDKVLNNLRGQAVPCEQLSIGDRSLKSSGKRITRLMRGVRGEDMAAEAHRTVSSGRHGKQRPPTSEVDQAEIRRLVAAGVPRSVVGAKLHKNHATVWKFWHGFGRNATPTQQNVSAIEASSPPFTAEELALISSLVTEGYTWIEISRRMPHRSIGALHLRWKKLVAARGEGKGKILPETGALRKCHYDTTELIRLLEMYQQGLAARGIAPRLGRSSLSVYRIISRLGVARSTIGSSKRLAELLDEYRAKVHKGLPPTTRPRWTPGELRIIEGLTRDGTPLAYIARLIDRNKYYLSAKVRKLKIQQIPWTKEEKEMLFAYCEQGLAPSQIAIKLGRSEHSVRGNLDLPPPEGSLMVAGLEGNERSPTSAQGKISAGHDDIPSDKL